MSPSLADAVRDRFPDFPKELRIAIANTKMKQEYGVEFWLDPHSKEIFKQVGKKVGLVAWGRRTNKEKLALYLDALKLFSIALQTLRYFNTIHTNFEPLQNLYRELTDLLPSDRPVQLELNLTKW